MLRRRAKLSLLVPKVARQGEVPSTTTCGRAGSEFLLCFFLSSGLMMVTHRDVRLVFLFCFFSCCSSAGGALSCMWGVCLRRGNWGDVSVEYCLPGVRISLAVGLGRGDLLVLAV